MRKKVFLFAFLVLCFVAFTGNFYVRTEDQRTAASQLEKHEKIATEIGYPLSIKDFGNSSEIDQESNGADLMIEAGATLGTNPKRALNLLAESTAKEECIFDWYLAQDSSFVPALRLQEFVTLTLKEAREDLIAGQSQDAFDKLYTAHVMASRAANVPTFAGLRASVQAERSLYEGLAQLLQERPDDLVLYDVTQEITRERRSPIQVRKAMQHLLVAKLEQAASASNPDVYGKGGYLIPVDPWLENGLRSRTLQIGLDLDSNLTSIQTYRELVAFLEAKSIEWRDDPRTANYVLRNLPEEYIAATQLAAENEALRRILFSSTAIFDSLRKEMQLPDNFFVTGPMSMDPYSEDKLIYKVVGLGFNLYSVGSDGIDDGGTTSEGFSTDQGDLGFKYVPFELSSSNS